MFPSVGARRLLGVASEFNGIRGRLEVRVLLGVAATACPLLLLPIFCSAKLKIP